MHSMHVSPCELFQSHDASVQPGVGDGEGADVGVGAGKDAGAAVVSHGFFVPVDPPPQSKQATFAATPLIARSSKVP